MSSCPIRPPGAIAHAIARPSGRWHAVVPALAIFAFAELACGVLAGALALSQPAGAAGSPEPALRADEPRAGRTDGPAVAAAGRAVRSLNEGHEKAPPRDGRDVALHDQLQLLDRLAWTLAE
jgi:hypothetical protein